MIGYALYGWGVPALIVGLCSFVYFSNDDRTDARPGFSYVDPRRLHCWMVGKDGVVVGLVLPFIWLLAASTYWFYKSWRVVHRTRLLSYKTGVKKRFKRPELILLHLYLKIILIYLCTWLLGFVSALTDAPSVWIAFVGGIRKAALKIFDV